MTNTIKLYVEEIPNGNKLDARPLGSVTITDDGTGSQQITNYNVTFEPSPGTQRYTTRSARIVAFPQRMGFLWLLKRALDKLEPLRED